MARTATTEDLVNKKPRQADREVNIGGEPALIKLQAISSDAYDGLIASHPPTKEQKEEGATWNGDTFAPALIAACLLEPKITRTDAELIWSGDGWSRGELRDLFMACVDICTQGLDVPFTLAD